MERSSGGHGANSGGVVFVVEDDPDCRRLIETILEKGLFRVRAFATGEAALAAIREEAPDAVVLDVKLPGLSGYEICQLLRIEFSDRLGVILVSGERGEPYDLSAGFLFGADDYVVKPFAPEELLARVRRLVRRAQADTSAPATATAPSTLSRRELEVLHLLAEGHEQRQIAEQLFISPKTVGTHIEHILTKLGVHSRAQAIAKAYRSGLLSTERTG